MLQEFTLQGLLCMLHPEGGWKKMFARVKLISEALFTVCWLSTAFNAGYLFKFLNDSIHNSPQAVQKTKFRVVHKTMQ